MVLNDNKIETNNTNNIRNENNKQTEWLNVRNEHNVKCNTPTNPTPNVCDI